MSDAATFSRRFFHRHPVQRTKSKNCVRYVGMCRKKEERTANVVINLDILLRSSRSDFSFLLRREETCIARAPYGYDTDQRRSNFVFFSLFCIVRDRFAQIELNQVSAVFFLQRCLNFYRSTMRPIRRDDSSSVSGNRTVILSQCCSTIRVFHLDHKLALSVSR